MVFELGLIVVWSVIAFGGVVGVAVVEGEVDFVRHYLDFQVLRFQLDGAWLLILQV